MKVKVTKTMVNTLNHYAQNRPFNFVYGTIAADRYGVVIDYDLFGNEHDYIPAKNAFCYIKVMYEPELYAFPRFITTKALTKLFVDGDTIESYCNRVVNEMEI